MPNYFLCSNAKACQRGRRKPSKKVPNPSEDEGASDDEAGLSSSDTYHPSSGPSTSSSGTPTTTEEASAAAAAAAAAPVRKPRLYLSAESDEVVASATLTPMRVLRQSVYGEVDRPQQILRSRQVFFYMISFLHCIIPTLLLFYSTIDLEAELQMRRQTQQMSLEEIEKRLEELGGGVRQESESLRQVFLEVVKT